MKNLIFCAVLFALAATSVYAMKPAPFGCKMIEEPEYDDYGTFSFVTDCSRSCTYDCTACVTWTMTGIDRDDDWRWVTCDYVSSGGLLGEVLETGDGDIHVPGYDIWESTFVKHLACGESLCINFQIRYDGNTTWSTISGVEAMWECSEFACPDPHGGGGS